MGKMSTIEDRNGDVWTGRETGRDNHDGLTDAAFGLMTAGLWFARDEKPTVTVKVNGEEHRGTEVKRR